MIGEFSDFALGHAQYLRHVRKRAAGLERREATHHGAMLPPLFGKDDVHHVIFAVVGEINVNVRQLVQRQWSGTRLKCRSQPDSRSAVCDFQQDRKSWLAGVENSQSADVVGDDSVGI